MVKTTTLKNDLEKNVFTKLPWNTNVKLHKFNQSSIVQLCWNFTCPALAFSKEQKQGKNKIRIPLRRLKLLWFGYLFPLGKNQRQKSSASKIELRLFKALEIVNLWPISDSKTLFCIFFFEKYQEKRSNMKEFNGLKVLFCVFHELYVLLKYQIWTLSSYEVLILAGTLFFETKKFF